MIEVNRQGEVWVYAEQQTGELREVVLELCGKARSLADELKVPAGAVLIGGQLKGLPEKLIAYGIDKVYVIEQSRLDHYQTRPYSRILCHEIEKHKPQIVLYGATPLGRDLAPRVASEIASWHDGRLHGFGNQGRDGAAVQRGAREAIVADSSQPLAAISSLPS